MKTVSVTLLLLFLILCLTAPAQTPPKDETPDKSILTSEPPFPDQNKNYTLFLADGRSYYGVLFLEHVGNKRNNWWRISYTSSKSAYTSSKPRSSEHPGLAGSKEQYKTFINLDQATRLAEVNATGEEGNSPGE